MIEFIVVVVVIGLLSYMFGFLDHMIGAFTVSEIIGGVVFVGLCLTGSAVGTYFILAYCHKLFGHIIFGG